MKFHPSLQAAVKVETIDGAERCLCPFCSKPLRQLMVKSSVSSLYCDCSKNISILLDPEDTDNPTYTKMYYRLVVTKKLFVGIYVNFKEPSTRLLSDKDLDVTVKHTNFPFFNEMAMRYKLKLYLPFL